MVKFDGHSCGLFSNDGVRWKIGQQRSCHEYMEFPVHSWNPVHRVWHDFCAAFRSDSFCSLDDLLPPENSILFDSLERFLESKCKEAEVYQIYWQSMLKIYPCKGSRRVLNSIWPAVPRRTSCTHLGQQAIQRNWGGMQEVIMLESMGISWFHSGRGHKVTTMTMAYHG